MGMHSLKAVLCVSALGWTVAGYAQDGSGSNAGPAAPATAGEDQIGDIIVTAQRRSESAQDVPISLQSFSSDILEQRAVSSTEDLTTVVSGLVVQQSGARPALFLRGVGNNSANTTPSILTFVDGVYQPFGFSTDLENVERVEVLKGPQGTLFGRNATGGVIQIITRPPSEEASARAEIGYGNYRTIDAAAYITGGLARGVAMDLSMRYRDQGNGFGTNVATGKDAFDANRATLRSRIRAELSDDTAVTVAGDYSRVRQMLGSVFNPAFGYGTLFVDGALRRFGGSYFPGDYDVNSNASGLRTYEWGGSLTLETGFSGLTMRSITAYRRGSERAVIDSDGGPTTGVHIVINRTPRTSFTQELQLLSSDDGPLQWVAGVFYYRGKLVSDPFGFFGSGAEAIFRLPAGGRITANAADIADSIAGYAQATHKFSTGTKLTLGGRYTVEKRSTTGIVRINGVEVAGRGGKLELKFKEPTWRVALDQDITSKVMIYGSISRGFNSGYFNSASVGGFASETVNPRVNPEFLTAYETGMKADLLDRRLRVNISAFRYDYKGLQQQIYEFGTTKTINAGAARIKGVDLEVTARPVSSLTLSLAGSYLDAKYRSYPLAPDYVPQPNGSIIAVGSRDAAGRHLTNTPEWNYNASVTHVLSTSIGEFSTTANLSYRGKTFVDPQNRFELPTRYVLDLTERWTSVDKRLFASIWAKNLLDKQYDYAISVVTPAGLVGLHAPPRTYGASIGFQF